MSRIRTTLRAAVEMFTAPQPVDQIIVAQKRAGWTLAMSRDVALQVPAILRGRNLICSISTLPLTQYAPDDRRTRSPLFEQLDPQVANVVVVAQTVEDLLFDGLSWWRVIERGWNRFPTKVQHVEVQRVHLNPPPGAQSLNMLPSGEDPSAAVWIDTEVVPGSDMIRFDSPNPPLLRAARRAIRRAVLLEKAAERYAESPKALGFFTPTEGADPVDDDEIAELLADWNDARNTDAEGYVPAALKYNPLTNPSPADLQLVQLQARATLDIANALGLDPEDLGVSTTSRTYQNATDRRQDRINDVLAPYMRAVTDRLSMPDVTRRGYRVWFDLADYLKADPITRATVAEKLDGLGAITVDEIRADDGRPVLTPAQRRQLTKAAQPPALPAAEEAATVANTAAREYFTAEVMTVRFDAEDFKADAARRRISGMLLPYGAIGRNGRGAWKFSPGSVTWNSSAVSRVKLNREHNPDALLGSAIKIQGTDRGITAEFKIARGPDQDAALALAEDEALDGFSVEVDILEYDMDPSDEDVRVVTSARLKGVALTAMPAFDDSRLTSVAASTTGKDPEMPTATATAAALDVTSEEFKAALATAVREALASAEGPAKVNPRRTAVLDVTRNELPYAFRGRKAEHDFSTDMFAIIKRNDSEAAQRIEGFMTEVFGDDVSTGDVDELNPTRNRPDLYVDNLSYTTPVWTAINKGSIPDSTPFTVPRFATATTVVSDHVEGTEPTAGVFTTDGVTITPTAVSGKFEITRETIDQGGNPQVSTIIWAEIVRAYNEALEVKAVAMLDALSPTAIALNGVDADLDQDVVTNFALLQYIRGGNRFREFFLASDLFTALVKAVDDRGRRLYPILAPSNTGGTTAPDYSYLQVGSLSARPAWALEVANGGDGSSYLFNSSDCHGWATAPRRFDFEFEVKSVWLGVMGYIATANTRLAGVREVTYSAV